MTPFTSIRSASRQLLMVTAMIFFSLYARLVLSPLLIEIQEALSLDIARATQLFVPLSIAYSITMLLSGFISARIGHRRTIALSGVVAGVGLIGVGVSTGYAPMVVSFSLVGAGSGLYPPSGVASVSALVHHTIRGRALAIHEMGPNVAFVLSPLIVAIASPWVAWRVIPLASGALIVAGALRFERVSLAGAFPAERPRLGKVTRILAKGEFWAITILFSIAACATMGVFTILPTFLVNEMGYAESLVNTLVGASRVSGVVSVLVAGFLVDTFGVRRLVAGVFLFTALLTAGIGLLSGRGMLIAVVVQPMVIAAFFPAALSATSDLGPPELQSLAVAIMIPVVNLFSSGVFPAVMGLLSRHGAMQLGFVALSGVMVVALVLLPLLRGSERTHAVG